MIEAIWEIFQGLVLLGTVLTFYFMGTRLSEIKEAVDECWKYSDELKDLASNHKVAIDQIRKFVTDDNVAHSKAFAGLSSSTLRMAELLDQHISDRVAHSETVTTDDCEHSPTMNQQAKDDTWKSGVQPANRFEHLEGGGREA